MAVLHAEEAWSDVVREAQEVVELALKGMLRAAGIEPPKVHDYIPTEQYTAQDSRQALDDATWVVEMAALAIEPGS